MTDVLLRRDRHAERPCDDTDRDGSDASRNKELHNTRSQEKDYGTDSPLEPSESAWPH